MSKLQAPDRRVPDRRRYGSFTRAVQRVGQARSFTVAMRYAGTKLDRVLYRASRGRITLSGPSLPIMLLTTRDRKTGEPRTVPVISPDWNDRGVIVVTFPVDDVMRRLDPMSAN